MAFSCTITVVRVNHEECLGVEGKGKEKRRDFIPRICDSDGPRFPENIMSTNPQESLHGGTKMLSIGGSC